MGNFKENRSIAKFCAQLGLGVRPRSTRARTIIIVNDVIDSPWTFPGPFPRKLWALKNQKSLTLSVVKELRVEHNETFNPTSVGVTN